MTRPIVIAAHGTRSDEGQRTTAAAAEALARATRAAVTIGWIDVLEPTVDDVVASLVDPVVVPWLVGGGFHLQVDVARAAAANPSATVLQPVGDSDGLVAALVARLDDLAAPADAPVALVWAGSRHRAARQRVDALTARVEAAVGRSVTPVALAAGVEEPAVVLARMADEAPGHAAPVVLTMLLAPGYFHDRLLSLADDVALAGVTPPVGPHPALVAAVADAYRALESVPAAP